MQYLATGYFWETPQKAFSISTEIDAKRFDDVESAKNVCLFALGFEEKFQLVVDNYIEWETELLKQAQSSILWQTNRFESLQHSLLLARRLVNVLTGFRLYLDQTDHALSKVFGNPSEELQAIKEFKKKLYDKHFGYRFLEALRNHVQHCELPVEIVTFNQKLVDRDKTAQIQFSVIPQASLKALAENNDFKKSILIELEDGPENIDLRPPVREYVSCLASLHKELGRVFSPVAEKSRNYYQDAIKEYSTIDGKVVQFPKFIFSDDAGLKQRTVELYGGFLEIYDNLKRRNDNVKDVSKSFASNAVNPK